MKPHGISEAINDVADFHRAMSQPMRSTPSIPPDDRIRLRARLLVEELGETLAAMFDEHAGRGGLDISIAETIDQLQELVDSAPVRVDLVGVADGLADLIYVAIGAGLETGIPLDRVWVEVQRSNLSKRGGEKRPDGKIGKPPGWTPPDVRAVLFDRPRYHNWADIRRGPDRACAPAIDVDAREKAIELYGADGAGMWDQHVAAVRAAKLELIEIPATDPEPAKGMQATISDGVAAVDAERLRVPVSVGVMGDITVRDMLIALGNRETRRKQATLAAIDKRKDAMQGWPLVPRAAVEMAEPDVHIQDRCGNRIHIGDRVTCAGYNGFFEVTRFGGLGTVFLRGKTSAGDYCSSASKLEVSPARLDESGDAKPLTELVAHVKLSSDGSFSVSHADEYRKTAADGGGE